MRLIQLNNVWKTYLMGNNQVHALRGITLEVNKGEFLAILGPSGSGKSTAMNIIGLLDTPSKGKVLLEGKDVTTLSEDGIATIRGKTIGFVFQKFNLLPTLTAQQNVMLPLLFQGLDEETRAHKATIVLEKVGLKERMLHKPNELSGGQQQRVAIARALVNDPPIILADEPTGNLDSVTGHQIIDLLRELNKEGRTVILVTHEKKLADHAHRRIRIEDGKIV